MDTSETLFTVVFLILLRNVKIIFVEQQLKCYEEYYGGSIQNLLAYLATQNTFEKENAFLEFQTQKSPKIYLNPNHFFSLNLTDSVANKLPPVV